MVGYRRNDSMTKTQKLIAGILSGVTTRFITQPMDVIKVRAQLLKKAKSKSVVYRIARRILHEEGITAFWHGHCLGQPINVSLLGTGLFPYREGATLITTLALCGLAISDPNFRIQMHSVLAVSSQFYIYEITTQYTAAFDIPKKYRPIQHFCCGTLAGCVCTTLVIPLEVIRVRQIIVKDQYKGLIRGARAVYRYGGPLAFYEGLSASLLQMGPQVGISFAVFTFCQPRILKLFAKCPKDECHTMGNKYKPQYLVFASSIAGSAAGFVSKTLTYPFDLAKRRLQISSHKMSLKYKIPSQTRSLQKCEKLTQCLIVAYKKEGIKGLFRGWTVTVYKAQLTSVMAFTSYELICYFIREFTNKPVV